VYLRGTVTAVGEPRSVSTQHGERDLVELSVRLDGDASAPAFSDGGTAAPDGDGPATVTLWGKWAETAEHATAGMGVAVTDAERTEFRGERGFATTGDSFVVLDPTYLVDVTDLRGWVQCPRIHYLNKLRGIPLATPVTKGTVVHEVFGDLLRGRDLEDAVEERVAEARLELGLLGESAGAIREEVRQHAGAIEGWLEQETLTGTDEWRSEQSFLSPTFGLKGRADAVRNGMPVELKTGKNTDRDPRFQDKVQAACYALLLRERGVDADTGTLLYTKNATIDDAGDLSPAKEFSVGHGLLAFVVRTRNELVGMEFGGSVPTGYEADATCEYCFERDGCMAVAGRLDQEAKAGTVGEPVPEADRAYFRRWYDRIETERGAVHSEYAKLWEQSPAERADDDRALIDLDPVGRERTADGRWRLSAARPEPVASKIREGDVVLASDGDPVAGETDLARVEELTAESVVVTAEEPFELRRVDVYPSELSVDRMLTALHDAVLTADGRRRDLLLGRAEPRFEDTERSFEGANPAQSRALARSLNAEDLALVHGPPGTGKTYTIARLVRELVADGQRVLLSAFTNRAVDNAMAALAEQGFADAVRMGTTTGVREDMQSFRLDRSGTASEQAAALSDAPVVAATTATCGSRVMREQSFDVAVVDEATQLTEPGTLAAINRADRFVLVGDHQQLPPVVRTEELGESLFERLVEAHPDAAVLLDRQYRMAQRIQAFSSREFYDGALRPASGGVAGQSLADLGVAVADLPAGLRDPVAFLDVEGDGGAHTDAVEAERVAGVVGSFIDAGVEPGDVGVIAPFRAQVAEVGRRVPAGVTVDTVDRFQGSAKEVIVVSFVATGSLDGPIFEDHRRLNVALTRARRALVLVGDEGALGSEPLYARMLDWANG
jgi:DNA replication ATP-dependent helicase Dna2